MSIFTGKYIGKWALFLLLAFFAFSLSCSPTEGFSESSGFLDSPDSSDSSPTDAKSSVSSKARIVPPREEASVFLNKEVAELVEKSKEISGYHYAFASRKRDTFGNYQDESYSVVSKGNLVKKVYLSPKAIEGGYSDLVYIDEAAKKAVGVCANAQSVLCESRLNVKTNLPYEQHQLEVVPLSIIQQIDPAAKKIGVETVDSRSVAVLEYAVSGGKEKVYVDTYYGLPLQWDIYSISGDEEILQKQYSFTRISVNDVKDAEVQVPS